jgi:four helix bundle protein
MAKGDDIENRLLGFAAESMELCDRLRRSPTGAHIADQLLRSATSAAPNYGEARGAESQKDFIHKIGITLKELNESRIWLRMIQMRGQRELQETADKLYKECDELCRIFATSKKTANANCPKK